MTKQIRITLNPNGTMHSETINIKGKECLNYEKLLKKLINSKRTKIELKEEYYQENVVEENVVEKENNF